VIGDFCWEQISGFGRREIPLVFHLRVYGISDQSRCKWSLTWDLHNIIISNRCALTHEVWDSIEFHIQVSSGTSRTNWWWVLSRMGHVTPDGWRWCHTGSGNIISKTAVIRRIWQGHNYPINEKCWDVIRYALRTGQTPNQPQTSCVTSDMRSNYTYGFIEIEYLNYSWC
jgi:hypothetical protein